MGLGVWRNKIGERRWEMDNGWFEGRGRMEGCGRFGVEMGWSGIRIVGWGWIDGGSGWEWG